MSWKRPNIGSRVSREVHARFWEHAEVRFLRVTRQAYLKIDGRLVYLRCAVDAEGEVLDVLVQPIHYLFFSMTCDKSGSFFRLGLAVSVR